MEYPGYSLLFRFLKLLGSSFSPVSIAVISTVGTFALISGVALVVHRRHKQREPIDKIAKLTVDEMEWDGHAGTTDIACNVPRALREHGLWSQLDATFLTGAVAIDDVASSSHDCDSGSSSVAPSSPIDFVAIDLGSRPAPPSRALAPIPVHVLGMLAQAERDVAVLMPCECVGDFGLCVDTIHHSHGVFRKYGN
jgi:hypothetical protein